MSDDTKPEITVEQALQMAVALHRSDDLERAEEIYVDILTHLPNEPNALNFLGVLRFEQGRNDEALHYLARSVQIRPEVAGAWLNLSNVLLESGEYDEAVKVLRRVVDLEPDNIDAYNNLGVLHGRRKQWELAEQCLRLAIERNPNHVFTHYNLGNLCFQTGRHGEAIDHCTRAMGMDPDDSHSVQVLCAALLADGQIARGKQILNDWLAKEPDNPRALHQLAAAGFVAPPARASDGYIQQTFDSFASSFDAKLESLGYRAPQFVADALAELGSRVPRNGVVLDAGCGTGLCASLLRPFAHRLEGVDLSAGMLARAKARAAYDALHHAELSAFLQRGHDLYDIVVSADTLIYFGDLDPVFAGLQQSMREGGVLAATLEVLAEDGIDHVLTVSGRYAHSGVYLRGLIERHGLQIGSLSKRVLRREAGANVEGWVFTAIKETRGG
ncbi:MAG: tetratricopeptide repeat protein [Ideonella sp.]